MSIHVRNQHRLHVAAPAAVAFNFFTPQGEELWIDEWRPRYINPSDGRTTAGMVFTTGEGEEFTIWLVVDFDPAGRRARYVRTTPAARIGLVSVQATPLDANNCEVLVEYGMTALGTTESEP